MKQEEIDNLINRLQGFDSEELQRTMTDGLDEWCQTQAARRRTLRRAAAIAILLLTSTALAMSVVPQWRPAFLAPRKTTETASQPHTPRPQPRTAPADSAEAVPARARIIDYHYLGRSGEGYSVTYGLDSRTLTYTRREGNRLVSSVMHDASDSLFYDTLNPTDMNSRMRTAAMTAALALMANSTKAQVDCDFQSVTPQGDTLFYTIIDSAAGHVSVQGDTYVAWDEPYIHYNDTLLIPATVAHDGRQYTVTALADNAFAAHYEIQSIQLPATLTAIGRRAMRGTNITELVVPDGVDSIGPQAFFVMPNVVYHGTAAGSPWAANNVNGYREDSVYYADATKTRLTGAHRALSAFMVPQSVVTIGPNAFRGCANLFTVILPEGLDTIDRYAFMATPLRALTIPRTVRYIGRGAFHSAFYPTAYDQPGVADVVIQNAEVTIDRDAFAYSYLRSINFGQRLVSLGTQALGNCSKLNTEVVIPSSCRRMGDSCFVYCVQLPRVVIPEGIDTLGEAAFRGCIRLAGFVLPSTVRRLGAYAFMECYALDIFVSKATVPPAIESNTFYGIQGRLQLVVPCHSAEAYDAAPHWGAACDYSIEEDCTGIAEPAPRVATVSVGRGTISVSGSEGEGWYVYDTKGHLLDHRYYDGTVQVDRPGVYIVQIGNRPSQKVVVKF